MEGSISDAGKRAEDSPSGGRAYKSTARFLANNGVPRNGITNGRLKATLNYELRRVRGRGIEDRRDLFHEHRALPKSDHGTEETFQTEEPLHAQRSPSLTSGSNF